MGYLVSRIANQKKKHPDKFIIMFQLIVKYELHYFMYFYKITANVFQQFYEPTVQETSSGHAPKRKGTRTCFQCKTIQIALL